MRRLPGSLVLLVFLSVAGLLGSETSIHATPVRASVVPGQQIFFLGVPDAAPLPPASPVPADKASGITTLPPDNHVTLAATVSDPDGGALTVSYYGRPRCNTPDFTLVALPDTQYYAAEIFGGTREIWNLQVQWVIDNRAARNIPYVAHLGDIVEFWGSIPQWQVAGSLVEPKGAMTRLEEAGMPYGLAVGNHDGGGVDTRNFNATFPYTRVGDGHFGDDNDNQYGLFSSGDLDFIAVFIEYGANDAARAWANDVLQQYSSRRAIVITHDLLADGSPAPFSAQGAALYEAIKGNANLFLMLGGHDDPEAMRSDTYQGHTVYSLRSDYQNRFGGRGWLRLMEFRTAANEIQVYTYSPYLDRYERDADSQFVLPYDMSAAGCVPFELLGTVSGVPSGTIASLEWPGRGASAKYDWYVTVSDGTVTATGPTWSFATGTPNAARLSLFRATSAAGPRDWLLSLVGR